jgi:predicted nucleic acid-binding protein
MTPVTFLLDTSALLLHYFKAPGADRIHRIISDENHSILVASVSITDLGRCLVATGCDPMEARSSALSYATLSERVVPGDTAVSARAFELGVASRTRLPLVDALIAACASIFDATLVHRDDHFLAIPPDLLSQVDAAT